MSEASIHAVSLVPRPSLNVPSGRYTIYGLRIASDFNLPTAERQDSDESPIDIVVVHVRDARPEPDGPLVKSIPCEVHGEDARQFRGPRGTWIWFHSVGMICISADCRRVEVYPDPGVPERMVGLALCGPVLLFIRFQLGTPSLHASAVVTDRGAVCFLGVSGQGKSTMAGIFLRHGSALLSDDAVGLSTHDGVIYGEPGPAYMKIWQETALRTLVVHDDLPVLAEHVEKKLLDLAGRYEVATECARIHRIYLLDRYDPTEMGSSDITIDRLSGRSALLALLAHTSSRPYLLPSDDVRALPTYARLVSQATVATLRYPSGFECQDQPYARVLADMCAA